MAISINRYVDVTSGVGGAAQVAGRELMGRIFTGAAEITDGELLTFTSASAVGDKFGTDSEEYKRAVFYFGFITKQISSPKTLGFYGVDSTDAASIVASFATSVDSNNNFGSFCYTDDLIDAIALANIVEIAAANKAYNNMFQFCTTFTSTTITAACTALADYAGTSVTLSIADNDFYPEMQPMCILAGTNFDAAGAAQNYMFTDSVLPATVFDDTTADAMDAINANYMGKTQTGGKGIKFYQRGYLMGLATDARDMGVYANEQWFKDSVSTALMNMLLAAVSVEANASGVATVVAAINPSIELAKINGTISQGKALTATQQVFITSISGDERAHFQVANQGYWLGAIIVSEVAESGATEYTIKYTLIYSKNDSIRKVEGSQILI